MHRTLLGLLLVSALFTALAKAEIRHVPNDYPSLEAAVAASASGDTIVVAEGLWGVPDTLRVPAGLTIRSEGRRELTEILIWTYNRVILVAGPDTTRFEDLTLLCAYEGPTVSVESFNPHTSIRRCRFLDYFASGGWVGVSLLMHAGGVVERSAFDATAYTAIRIDGGDSTLVRYNTWTPSCGASGTTALDVTGNPRKVEFRNNTVKDQELFIAFDPPSTTTVDIVNNILKSADITCGGFSPFDVRVRYNYMLLSELEGQCEGLPIGPGNIVVPGTPVPHPVFCNVNACTLTVHSEFPGVDAGENGETMGAWPIGCGVVPVDPIPDGPGVIPYALIGRPLPNPTDGGVELFVGVVASTIEVFDASGRHVRSLRAPDAPDWVRWDGRTSRGGPAPSGSYFLRVMTGEGREAVRRVRIVR